MSASATLSMWSNGSKRPAVSERPFCSGHFAAQLQRRGIAGKLLPVCRRLRPQ